MTATLTLSDAATTRVARVPLSAIYNQGSGPALFVADKSRLRRAEARRPSRPTRPATRSSSSGVEEGESVVTLGVHKLDPGQKVRVVSSLSF